jgi:hypothetical protein
VFKLRSSTEADLLCEGTISTIRTEEEAKAVRLKPPAWRHAVIEYLISVTVGESGADWDKKRK